MVIVELNKEYLEYKENNQESKRGPLRYILIAHSFSRTLLIKDALIFVLSFIFYSFFGVKVNRRIIIKLNQSGPRPGPGSGHTQPNQADRLPHVQIQVRTANN
jgi:hypothetical protein